MGVSEHFFLRPDALPDANLLFSRAWDRLSGVCAGLHSTEADEPKAEELFWSQWPIYVHVSLNFANSYSVIACCNLSYQDAHQLVGQAKHRATKIRPKAVGSGIFGPCSNVYNFRPEACSDVISSEVVEPTGTKVHVKFGDSRSNRCRDVRLPHFVANDNDAGGRTL